MANHPNRSTNLRTVAFKIQDGGGLAAVSEHSTSDLTIKITGVPQSIATADVMLKLRGISLLRWSSAGHWTIMGPFSFEWERIADATQGSILKIAPTPKAE